MLYVISLLVVLPFIVIPFGNRIGKNHGYQLGKK